MIIIVSNDFLKSSANRFIMNYVQSLAIGKDYYFLYKTMLKLYLKVINCVFCCRAINT